VARRKLTFFEIEFPLPGPAVFVDFRNRAGGAGFEGGMEIKGFDDIDIFVNQSGDISVAQRSDYDDDSIISFPESVADMVIKGIQLAQSEITDVDS
jgi:hypothetical protein